MPVVGDVIEFKDFQALANIGGDVLNVYHYRVESIDTAIGLEQLGEALRDWFYDEFLPPILALQSNSIQHTRLEVNNLMAYNTDFWVGTPASGVTGTVPGEYLSASVAWSFRLARSLRTTRNGSKRIGGVAESLAQNNLPVLATIPLLGAAAVSMGAVGNVPYGVGNNMTLQPVIVRKAALVTTPPLAVNAVSEVFFRGLGSQNTRKQLL